MSGETYNYFKQQTEAIMRVRVPLSSLQLVLLGLLPPVWSEVSVEEEKQTHLRTRTITIDSSTSNGVRKAQASCSEFAETLAAVLGPLGAESCVSNSDCDAFPPACCLEDFCLCKGSFNGGTPSDKCMGDTPLPTLPPLEQDPLAINWYQCTSNTVCDTEENILSPLNCAGVDSQPDDANCDEGEQCDVFCDSIGRFCYNESDGSCMMQACNSVECGDGLVCVDELSYQCGPRVCRNASMEEDLGACNLETNCRDIPCEDGFECVGLFQNCSIAA